MDKIFNWTSTVIGIVGGFFAALFGKWDSILWALLVIMVLDYLTGVIKAIYTKTMSSEILPYSDSHEFPRCPFPAV